MENREKALKPPFHRCSTAAEIAQLLESGADVNCRDAHGSTALHYIENPAALRLLIAAGADVNATNLYGDTPLHRHKLVACVRVLIESGADVNAVSKLSDTPLNTAFFPASVFELLRSGANPNYRNEDGELPEAHYGSSIQARIMCDMINEVRSCGRLLQPSWKDYANQRYPAKKIIRPSKRRQGPIQRGFEPAR